MINLEQVLVFFGRISDISPLHPGKVIRSYMVTKQGFTTEAQKFAKHYNIELCRVQSADEFGIRYLDNKQQICMDALVGKAGFSGSLEEVYTPANNTPAQEADERQQIPHTAA
jgi:hypothetical protein